jgi:hypothetical protein
MINGDNPSQILLDASRNVLSFNIFVNLVLLHFIEYTNNKKLSIIPTFLFLIISIWAKGRAGIICSILYFLYIIFNYFISNKNILYKLFLLIICLVVFYFFVKNISLDEYFYRLQNEGIDYGDDARYNMVSYYLNKINLFTLITGYNYFNDSYFVFWNNNPHNSFIRLHSCIGLFFLPFVLFIFIRLKHYLKRNSFFCVALSLLLFRGWIDTFFFLGRYDFLIFIFLFYGYKSKIISFPFNHDNIRCY